MTNKLKIFFNKLNSLISDKNSDYVKRNRKDGNKLDFINVLFASVQSLKTSTNRATTKLMQTNNALNKKLN